MRGPRIPKVIFQSWIKMVGRTKAWYHERVGQRRSVFENIGLGLGTLFHL